LQIKELAKAIADLDLRIKELLEKIDSTPEEIQKKKEKAQNKLDQIEIRLTEIDSILTTIRDSLNVLDGSLSDAIKIIERLSGHNDEMKGDTSKNNIRLDTLRNLLTGKPSAQEELLLENVRNARNEQELADSLLALYRSYIIEQADILKQNIQNAEKSLDQITKTYTQLKTQAETLTKAIADLETKRFRKTGASSYYMKKSTSSLYLLIGVLNTMKKMLERHLMK